MKARLDAADIGNRFEHLLRLVAQASPIVAEDLDHDLAVDLRNAFQHVVADGLGKTGLDAGQRIEALSISSIRFVPWSCPPPFGWRF